MGRVAILSRIEVRHVKIMLSELSLDGDLTVPQDARGIILFAHGSGSSRGSPRNRFVASILQEAGFATLLMDLLTKEEEVADYFTGHLRFNVSMLAGRLTGAKDWLQKNEAGLVNLGYFGASTGAAAALISAAEHPEGVQAVVSRGGRPDLAAPSLSRVQAPTLLIVGGNDSLVIGLNQEALKDLRVVSKLEIVPGATHLFEEPGALEQVSRLATAWFKRYLQ